MQCPYIFTFCFFIFLCFFQFFCSVYFYFCFLLSAGHRLFFDGVVYLCIDSWFFFCFYVFDCRYIWNLNLDLILLVISLISIERPLIRNAFVSFLLCSDWCWSFTFFKMLFSFYGFERFFTLPVFSLCSECVAYNLNFMCMYQFGTSLVRCINRVRRTHTPKPCVLHMQTAYISIKTPRCHWIEQNPFQQLHSRIFPNNKLKKKSQRKTRNENTTKR